jgi:hypothetical protein
MKAERAERTQRAGGMLGTYEIADSELDVRNVTAHNCKCDARPPMHMSKFYTLMQAICIRICDGTKAWLETELVLDLCRRPEV